MPSGSKNDVIAGAGARADARLDAAIADFFLADDGRLDDRTRIALRTALHRLIGAIEGDIRRHAARLLAGRGHADAAQAMLGVEGEALPLLTGAGLLRDAELMDEAIAQIRVLSIEEALPAGVVEGNQPSLLVRLADLSDSVVAGAAQALMTADSRRGGSIALPAELHHRLVWWVAAAVRAAPPGGGEADAAIADAGRRALAAHDEGERPDAVAQRLVAAIDPLPAELPSLVVEALGDRRLSLVAAIVSRALSIDPETARALLIEPDDRRLWLALRAIDLSREQIARVALSLADADPRRDIEAFADRLDDIAALDPAAARASLAPLALPRELRLATRALAKARR